MHLEQAETALILAENSIDGTQAKGFGGSDNARYEFEQLNSADCKKKKCYFIRAMGNGRKAQCKLKVVFVLQPIVQPDGTMLLRKYALSWREL